MHEKWKIENNLFSHNSRLANIGGQLGRKKPNGYKTMCHCAIVDYQKLYSKIFVCVSVLLFKIRYALLCLANSKVVLNFVNTVNYYYEIGPLSSYFDSLMDQINKNSCAIINDHFQTKNIAPKFVNFFECRIAGQRPTHALFCWYYILGAF